MRNRSVQDLINATPGKEVSTFWEYHSIYFTPTIDGWVLPSAPEEVFKRSREDPVPLIIGNNADEGASLIAGINMTVPEYEQYIWDYFGGNATQVLKKYPTRTSAEIPHQMARIITDYDFDGAARLAAGSMANLNRDVYLYRFTYVLPAQPNGAFHGSELPFVFKPSSILKQEPNNSTVSDNMIDFWIRFAKTGNPNGGVNVTWPKYNTAKDQYLDIGVVTVVKTGF